MNRLARLEGGFRSKTTVVIQVLDRKSFAHAVGGGQFATWRAARRMEDRGADLTAYPVDAPTDVTAAVRDARAGVKAWPTYTLDDVSKHKTKDDCWIVVNDCVIDMTSHVRNHPGWNNGSKVSTLLAILSAMGQDCTDEFVTVHSQHAKRQLAAFKIGMLDQPNKGVRSIRYRTWEELEAAGVV